VLTGDVRSAIALVARQIAAQYRKQTDEKGRPGVHDGPTSSRALLLTVNSAELYSTARNFYATEWQASLHRAHARHLQICRIVSTEGACYHQHNLHFTTSD
jgi:hypothetical protein